GTGRHTPATDARHMAYIEKPNGCVGLREPCPRNHNRQPLASRSGGTRLCSHNNRRKHMTRISAKWSVVFIGVIAILSLSFAAYAAGDSGKEISTAAQHAGLAAKATTIDMVH